jgi:hypothetical protein
LNVRKWNDRKILGKRFPRQEQVKKYAAEVKMSQTISPEVHGGGYRKSVTEDKARMQDAIPASARESIGKIGFWSAVLTTLSSCAYGIAVIVYMVSSLPSLTSSQSPGWSGIEPFLAAFQPIQMLPVIPSLILAPAFTALMVSIHYYASEARKIWSCLGLAFTLIYATMALMNYMVQLLPVWRSLANNETDGLAMFVLGNPHSIFWALAYSYFFMNIGMLFSAQVFGGDPLRNRIRLLFILNGLSGLVTLFSAVLDSPPIYLLGSLVVWCPIFTLAAAYVALLFRRQTLEASSG